jgi:arylsulfatase A-like enzyme
VRLPLLGWDSNARLAILLTGAALGACLAGAELAARYLTGGAISGQWWVLVFSYYVPGLAFCNVVLAILVAVSSGQPSKAGSRSLPLSFHVVSAAYLFVVLFQESFRDRYRYPVALALLAASLPAAGALWLMHRLLTARRAGNTAWYAAPFALTMSIALALIVARGHSPVMVALSLCAVPFAALAATAFVWSGLRQPGSRLTVLAAAGLMVALAVILVHDRRDEADVYFKDEPQPAPGARGGPNVVLIVLDSVRARQLSCYGYSRTTTPRIDAFSRQGVRFTRCHSTASTSLPSHASLFTGLFPTRHGAHAVRSDTDSTGLRLDPLGPSVDTLADILRSHHYATAGISANFAQVTRAHGLDRGFGYYEAFPSDVFSGTAHRPLIERIWRQLPTWFVWSAIDNWVAVPYRPAEEINEKARKWLLQRRRPGAPYFLFLNYMDAHTPYAVRKGFGQSAPEDGVSHGFPVHYLPFSTVREVSRGERDLTRAEAAHIASLYNGSLSYLDEQVGRFIDFIDQQADGSKTWIIVTSDHGESLGEHRTLMHGTSLYEELIHVPLIVRPPSSSSRPRGIVDERLIQLVDVLPLILDAVGIDSPPRLDGIAPETGREAAYAESSPNSYQVALAGARQRRDLRALIYGTWKYIESSNTPEELFDLAQDPLELVNLANSHPARTADMRARLAAWKEALARGAAPAAAQQPVSAEQRERLRALGYLR